MSSIIEQIAEKLESLQRHNKVLATCLEVYQTGLIRPKDETLYHVEAVEGVAGGIIKLAVPREFVGRRFKVILER